MRSARRSFYFLVFFGLLGLLGGGSCSGGSSTTGAAASQSAIAKAVFSDAITSFTLKVVYEVGAEPIVDPLPLGAPTWYIARDSVTALFSTHTARTVTVPATLADMQLIADQGRTTWTSAQLTALGDAQFGSAVSGTAATLGVIFLNGTYEGDTGILGIHITGRPYAFVFKDVVASVGGTAFQQKYIEQATVMHELGHALGLVNNGVPMVAAHEDVTHAHHSSDTNCVMYWAVEGKSTVLSMIGNFSTANRRNVFGTNSLNDGRAYHP